MPRAEFSTGRDLALGDGAQRNHGRSAAAARGQCRQSRDRRRGVTEARDQLAVGDRADLRGSDQRAIAASRHLVQGFGRQGSVGALPIRGSVPLSRRSIFSRCFHRTSSASRAAAGRFEGREEGGADRSAHRRGHAGDDEMRSARAGSATPAHRPKRRASAAPARSPSGSRLPCPRGTAARSDIHARGTPPRRRQSHIGPDQNRCCASHTADEALGASSSSVAAASPLRPVRRTLVAPILPEPIWRRSPGPRSRVRISPNGIEPSR